jgi:hypothetical protein
MTQQIIYPNDDGTIAIVYPALECGLAIEDIAQKDVPAGKPYLILNTSDMPQSYEFWAAWEADFTEPAGYGIGHEAWFANRSQA